MSQLPLTHRHLSILQMFEWGAYTTGNHPGKKRCTTCNKEFSSRSGLWYHMMKHKSVKPVYKCQYCGKEYSRTNILSLHVRRAHTHVDEYKKILDGSFTCDSGRDLDKQN
jgi:uncharacterized Zn-finger protein